MGSPENAAVQNSILTRLARRFHAARRGNVAVMTAVLMMPIMGLMGLAVDYGNAVFVKSRLDQAAQPLLLIFISYGSSKQYSGLRLLCWRHQSKHRAWRSDRRYRPDDEKSG